MPQVTDIHEFMTDEHLRFLDALRESGAVNMFGAGPVLAEAYEDELTEGQARKVVVYWMENFEG